MRTKLFGPLEMESAGFGAPDTVTDDQPVGHGRLRLFQLSLPFGSRYEFLPTAKYADYPLAASPAGLIHVTIADWAKFIELQLSSNVFDTHNTMTLLQRDIVSELQADSEYGYAGGWFVGTRSWAKGLRSDDKGRVLFHAGNNGRWSSVVWIAPELDYAFMIVCNRGDMSHEIDRAAQIFAGIAKRFAISSNLENKLPN